MATDRYHMRAYAARRRRTLATDPSLKADLELIAQEWLALAEEVEWLEAITAHSSHRKPPLQSETVVQQQQQSQPKDEDKKD